MLPDSSDRSALSRLAPVRSDSTSAPSSDSIASTRWSMSAVASWTLPTWSCERAIASSRMRCASRAASCSTCSAWSRASRSIDAALVSAASTIAWTWALAIDASDAPGPARVGCGRRRRGPRRALQRLDLAGDLGEVRVDARRLVAAAADGEVSLLDGLTVEGQLDLRGSSRAEAADLARQAGESQPRAVALDEPVALERRERALQALGRDPARQRLAATSAATTRPRTQRSESSKRSRAPRRRPAARSRTRPRDGHHGAAGQGPQRGARAVQNVAPSSIAAWFQSLWRRARQEGRGLGAQPRGHAADVRVDGGDRARRTRTTPPRPRCTGPRPAAAAARRRRAASRRARRSPPPRAGAARGGCSPGRPTP